MKNSSCSKIYDDLKAFNDHELAPLRRWAVARHLSGCLDCQQELKEMVQIAEEISSKRDDVVHELDKQQIAMAMAAAAPKSLPITTRQKRPYGLITAGAAVLVVGAIMFPVFSKVNEKDHMMADSPMLSKYAQSYDEVYGKQPQGQPFADASSAPAEAGGVIAHRFPSLPVTTNSSTLSRSDVETSANTLSPSITAADNQTETTIERQVHKSATITVQLADPESSGEKVQDIATTAGGFVTTSDLTTSDVGTKSYVMTVKLPLPQFEATLAQIAKLGSVQDKEVTGEDITEKVSDANAREQVLEDDMAQALDQLKKKGSHASWDLQQDARDLRIQLAQSRARLQLLRSLAELSEIDVTLSQPAKPAPPVQSGFFSDLSDTGHGALQSAAGAVVTLVTMLLWVLAYSPLWLPAILVGRWAWRRYNGDDHKAARSQDAS